MAYRLVMWIKNSVWTLKWPKSIVRNCWHWQPKVHTDCYPVFTLEGSDHKSWRWVTDFRAAVHLILGAKEYAKLKTRKKPRIGCLGEPIAEYTIFGWTVMSPGKEVDLTSMFLTQTSAVDYHELCNLDILGLKDTPIGEQEAFYDEFKDELTRNTEGWYETSLPWKGNHLSLPGNREGSLKRLGNLVRRLEKQSKLEKYEKIIQDQFSQGILEHKDEMVVGRREFYIPHKAVVAITPRQLRCALYMILQPEQMGTLLHSMSASWPGRLYRISYGVC